MNHLIQPLPIKMGLMAVLALSINLAGCSSMPQYTQDYQQARVNQQGITLSDAQAQQLADHFVQTFNKLGTPAFMPSAKSLYADELFINDTLSQYRQKSTLLDHFKGMNERIKHASVQLVQVTHAGDVAYVHWHMTYDLKVLGKVKTMQSYGISELKQNSANQIIFQQDFWDPANGLYRVLPYVGGVYRWLLPFKQANP